MAAEPQTGGDIMNDFERIELIFRRVKEQAIGRHDTDGWALDHGQIRLLDDLIEQFMIAAKEKNNT
jgi:hypothetical protein